MQARLGFRILAFAFGGCAVIRGYAIYNRVAIVRINYFFNSTPSNLNALPHLAILQSTDGPTVST